MSIIEKALERVEKQPGFKSRRSAPSGVTAEGSALLPDEQAVPPAQPVDREREIRPSTTHEPSQRAEATTPGIDRFENSKNRDLRTSRHVKLDMAYLKHQGLLTPDMPRSTLAEEYRMIKRPLLINAFGEGATIVENGNLIMVTSALPGEGKTFTAINLAMSVAMEMDRTVLLVDADIARPALTQHFGFVEELGLTDLLVEESVDFTDVLVRTDVPKLTILPAGTRHHNATELLASEYMRRLAAELSRRYPDRVVIFDTPPLLATSQASVLARLVGQVVVVVESGRAPRHLVKEALARIDATEIVGLLLNKTGQEFGSDYYYYGYGGYGYGSSEP